MQELPDSLALRESPDAPDAPSDASTPQDAPSPPRPEAEPAVLFSPPGVQAEERADSQESPSTGLKIRFKLGGGHGGEVEGERVEEVEGTKDSEIGELAAQGSEAAAASAPDDQAQAASTSATPRRRWVGGDSAIDEPARTSRVWSATEDAMLARLVWERRELVNYGDDGAWTEITTELGAKGRTRKQVQGRWETLVQEVGHALGRTQRLEADEPAKKASARSKVGGNWIWTASEDGRLAAALLAYDPALISFALARDSLQVPRPHCASEARWARVHKIYQAENEGVPTSRSAYALYKRCCALARRAESSTGTDSSSSRTLWTGSELKTLLATVVELGGDVGTDDAGWDEGVETVAMWALVRAAVGGVKPFDEVVEVWRENKTTDPDDVAGGGSPAGAAQQLDFNVHAAEDEEMGAEDTHVEQADDPFEGGVPGRSSQPWSTADDAQLLQLDAAHQSSDAIARQLGRTLIAIGKRRRFLQRVGASAASASPYPSFSYATAASLAADSSGRRGWTAEESDKLVQLRKEGVSVVDCAKQLARSYASTCHRVARLRAEGRLAAGRENAVWTDKDDARLVDMYKSTSVSGIAHALDRTTGVVERRIAKLRFEGRIADRVLPMAAPSAPVQPPGTFAKSAASGSTSAVGPSAQIPRKARPYSSQEDEKLLKLRQEGHTFSQIDRSLGRRDGSAANRWAALRRKQNQLTAAAGTTSTGAAPSAPSLSAALPSSAAQHFAPPAPPQPAPAVGGGALPAYTDADDATIISHLQQGLDYKMIASAIGRSTKSVGRRVQKKREEWVRLGLLAPKKMPAANLPPAATTAAPHRPSSSFAAPDYNAFDQLGCGFMSSLAPEQYASPDEEKYDDYSLSLDPSLLLGTSPSIAASAQDSFAYSVAPSLSPTVQRRTHSALDVDTVEAEQSPAKRQRLDEPAAASPAPASSGSRSIAGTPASTGRKRWLGRSKNDPWRRFESGMAAWRRLRELCEGEPEAADAE
ncbi:hypothetical protein JCM10450v2_007891 [Rhodotorula kratochvilovae]